MIDSGLRVPGVRNTCTFFRAGRVIRCCSSTGYPRAIRSGPESSTGCLPASIAWRLTYRDLDGHQSMQARGSAGSRGAYRATPDHAQDRQVACRGPRCWLRDRGALCSPVPGSSRAAGSPFAGAVSGTEAVLSVPATQEAGDWRDTCAGGKSGVLGDSDAICGGRTGKGTGRDHQRLPFSLFRFARLLAPDVAAAVGESGRGSRAGPGLPAATPHADSYLSRLARHGSSPFVCEASRRADPELRGGPG